MKIYLISILFLLFYSCHAYGQEYGRDYEGYYHHHSSEVKDFNNFWYFILEPVIVGKSFDTSECIAKWFLTDTLNNNGESIGGRMQYVYIWKDSLSFMTVECFGEKYAFVGRLIVPANRFPENIERPILEGLLSLFKHGTLKKQSKVTFIYNYPGD